MDYERISLIAGAVTAVCSIPFLPRLWAVAKCAWERVTGVWSALERLREDFNPENEQSVPARLTKLTDQGNERGLQLTAVQAGLTVAGETIARMDKKVDAVANTQRAVINTNPKVAAFDADANGQFTQVNNTFLRWTGLPPADLLDDHWYGAVHLDDRARVRSAWLTAVAFSQRFECTFRLVHATTGATTLVDASADPIPPGAAPCERWHGSIYQAQASAAA